MRHDTPGVLPRLLLIGALAGCDAEGSVGIDETEAASLSALQKQVTAQAADLAVLEERLAALEDAVITTGSLSDYVTQEWVEAQGFSSRSDLLLLSDLGAYLSVNTSTDDIFITGADVHIRSGSGATDDDDSLVGLGNLIIGYNLDNNEDRTGSHNLIIGDLHSYSSFGGIVTGYNNSIEGHSVSIIGANDSAVSGLQAALLGGDGGVVTGEAAVILGGEQHQITGQLCTITGGSLHSSGGDHGTITGGQQNTTSAGAAHISGGQHNHASDTYSSVIGGSYNEAAVDNSTVAAGNRNLADQEVAVVLGGQYNTASGFGATVVGGLRNLAGGQLSVIYAGQLNTTKALLEFAPAD